MGYFDDEKERIKDMEYDSERGRYVGKDGSEFRVTQYKDGTGYKYDYSFAYNRYKESILSLEQTYLKSKLERVLKK